MINKKSVVLSDIENTNKKAVLTIQEHENGLNGTLRLYNFARELDGVLSLGIFADQKVYKAGLTQTSHMLYSFFVNLKKIPNKFSCAVINFQNAEPKPILFGSSDGCSENIYGSIISEIAQENTYQNAKNVLDRYGVEFEEKEEIDKEIDEKICSECKNCSNCVYKKYFFENVKEEKTIDVSEEAEQKEEKAFYEKLRPQIEKLFEKNPQEKSLEKIIPNSKWIKVEYEDEGDFYVFGLLYDKDQQVKYVCYGVPAVYDEQAPEELSGEPIWTPLDKENEKGFGFWLTYQDAETGKPVKIVVD